MDGIVGVVTETVWSLTESESFESWECSGYAAQLKDGGVEKRRTDWQRVERANVGWFRGGIGEDGAIRI